MMQYGSDQSCKIARIMKIAGAICGCGSKKLCAKKTGRESSSVLVELQEDYRINSPCNVTLPELIAVGN